MKEKKQKRGGKRAGAGRKPSGRQNEAVTVYTDVSRFGGKVGARMAIYEFLNGKINDTGKSSFIPLDWTPEAHKKSKKAVIDTFTKAANMLEPQKQPGTQLNNSAAKDAILKEIEAIRAEKCPKERDTPMGRRSWAVDQHKRIQELQNKLK